MRAIVNKDSTHTEHEKDAARERAPERTHIC